MFFNFKTFAMSYKKLEIWQIARELVIDIHQISLQLPKFEIFEEGQQIRRSIKGVRSAIVEGYGRRRYRADFIKFLIYAQASADETIDHLEILYETNSFTNEIVFNQIHQKLIILGKKINNFIQAVEKGHNSFN